MRTTKPLRTALWGLLAGFGMLVLMAAPHPDVADAFAAVRRSFRDTDASDSRQAGSFRDLLPPADRVKHADTDRAASTRPAPRPSKRISKTENRFSKVEHRADDIPKSAQTRRANRTHRIRLQGPKTGGVDASRISTWRPAGQHEQQEGHGGPELFVERETNRPEASVGRIELGQIEQTGPAPRAAGRSVPSWQVDSQRPFSDRRQANVPQRSANAGRVETLPAPEWPPEQPINARLAAMQRTIDRLAQAQADRQYNELQRATGLLEQIQQSNRVRELEQQLQRLQSGGSAVPSAGDSSNGGSTPSAKRKTAVMKSTAASSESVPDTGSVRDTGRVGGAGPADDGERFSLQIQDADVTEILEMLGQMSGQNILIGKDVGGTVPSANLQNVTLRQALDGIVRSLGLAYEQDEQFIFIMTQAEHEARQKLNRKLISKVYRPSYISVNDLQALIAPLLTETIGKVAVTNPSEIGLATDDETAGGDRLSQSDAILVLDYAEVIQEVDALVEEMDVPPLQVVIEAMILSVRLNDEMRFGVNFALLNGDNKHLIVSGNGQTLDRSSGFPGTDEAIIPPMGDFIADAAGLKYGFIHGDVSAFIDALENIADTNLIASPQLRVLNKQKANLIIGDRLSYTTTTFNDNQTIQNVNFVDAGTKLIIRPFISEDGLVRMEVHPERSSARINPQTGLPDLQTTEVTTNVMVRDGMSVVIGGLIEEQIAESFDQVPLLGSLPWIGNAFRNKQESVQRSELIVLITPRIVHDPEDAFEGDAARFENERRADYFRNNLSSVNRNNLARMEYERARYYYDRGRYLKAREHVDRSLVLNKHDLETLRLRDLIGQAIGETKRRWFGLPIPAVWPGKGGSVEETRTYEPPANQSQPEKGPALISTENRSGSR